MPRVALLGAAPTGQMFGGVPALAGRCIRDGPSRSTRACDGGCGAVPVCGFGARGRARRALWGSHERDAVRRGSAGFDQPERQDDDVLLRVRHEHGLRCHDGPATLPKSKAWQAVSAVITGLSAGSTYHYRIVAWNGGGTKDKTVGSDHTFTTAFPPDPPSGAVTRRRMSPGAAKRCRITAVRRVPQTGSGRHSGRA